MNVLKKMLKKGHKLKLILTITIVLILGITLASTGIGLSKHFSTDGKTTKLGFEDIGELATQSVTCTSVRVDTKEKNLLGITIPFTKSKAVYSYDTTIKAGIDFSDVKCKLGDTKKTKKNIYVDIPEIRILSVDIDPNSFKIYHEDESIFAPITLEEHNESLKELEITAQNDAINNGLYDKAFENAKVLLTAFISQVYDPDEYKIIFNK